MYEKKKFGASFVGDNLVSTKKIDTTHCSADSYPIWLLYKATCLHLLHWKILFARLIYSDVEPPPDPYKPLNEQM